MAKRQRAPDDSDNPWKEALHLEFQAFLAFLFQFIHGDIDWQRGYVSLDKEFQRIARRAKVRKGLADKLFKVWLRDGSECWLLIHVEIQGDFDKDFAERMFRYNIAAYRMYNREVVSLAVLCDSSKKWRPANFEYGRWGCRTGIDFLTVKLLDFAEDLDTLERHENPFAALVLAHLQTLATKGDPASRWQWKFRIVKSLYQRKWPVEKIRRMFHLVDWMMELPKEFEVQFFDEVQRFEEETKMPYIDIATRRGIEIGIEKGIEQGIEKGIEKGIQKGMAQGKAIGLKAGLVESLAQALKIKFGQAGLKLLPRIRKVDDLRTLRKLHQIALRTEILDEIRTILAP